MTDVLHQSAADLADEAARLLAEVDRAHPRAAALRGECRPALDVIETSTTVEVVVDLAGVPRSAIRVAVRGSAVVIVGAKLPPASDGPTRFHVAERSYGHFARVVRVSHAVDSARATAVVRAGLLRVVLPRVEDRRGSLYAISVEAG